MHFQANDMQEEMIRVDGYVEKQAWDHQPKQRNGGSRTQRNPIGYSKLKCHKKEAFEEMM